MTRTCVRKFNPLRTLLPIGRPVLYTCPVLARAMSYQLYRSMSLGESLQAALDELISEQHITPDLALKVLQQYDRSMSIALSTKVRTRYTFKGHLKVYRYCDNVWTCVLQNVEFKDSHANEVITSERVKIVACEASSGGK